MQHFTELRGKSNKTTYDIYHSLRQSVNSVRNRKVSTAIVISLFIETVRQCFSRCFKFQEPRENSESKMEPNGRLWVGPCRAFRI